MDSCKLMLIKYFYRGNPARKNEKTQGSCN